MTLFPVLVHIINRFLSVASLSVLVGNTCTMSEYNRLKSTLLNLQPKLQNLGQQDRQRDMEEKRTLVDAMFKYLDVDRDGWLVGDELEKVGEDKKKKSEHEYVLATGLSCVAHLVEHPISIPQIISISIAPKNCSPVLIRVRDCFCLTISINYINPTFQLGKTLIF